MNGAFNPDARIVVVGAIRFSERCLRALLDCGAVVAGAVTSDARAARRHSDAASLEPIASEAGVPCVATADVNAPATLDWIRERRPDVLLAVGWSQLFAPPLLATSRLAVGSHPTLLPEGRGRHPIIWSLANGLTRGGLTLFVLGGGADDGDVLLQEPFDINADDDAGSVYEKVCRLGERMMPDLLAEIHAGLPHRRSQDESCATYYRKRTEKDGEIDWSRSTVAVRNLVRALAKPYPGAHTYVLRAANPLRLTIWKSSVVPSEAAASHGPGAVTMNATGTPVISTGDGRLALDSYDPPGALCDGDMLGAI